MPKKRKRGADLHCRKKHNRPGRAIIRMRINGIENNIKNHFKSTEANSNIDIAMFDVTEFEKELFNYLVVEKWKKKKNFEKK